MRQSRKSWCILSVVVCATTFPFQSNAFIPLITQQEHRQQIRNFSLQVKKSWFVPDEEDPDGLVSREMLQRDLLEDPQVKRKNKKGKGYQPRDNRDHLPFAVKQITPDPYTHPEIKRTKKIKSPKGKKSDLEMIGARLSLQQDDTSTLLGEFQLDKTTTSGDIIELANGRQYKVQTARCQYKYAGGKRFVMVGGK